MVRNHIDEVSAILDYDRRRSAAQPKSADWSVAQAAKVAMVAQSERAQLARFLRQRGFRLD